MARSIRPHRARPNAEYDHPDPNIRWAAHSGPGTFTKYDKHNTSRTRSTRSSSPRPSSSRVPQGSWADDEALALDYGSENEGYRRSQGDGDGYEHFYDPGVGTDEDASVQSEYERDSGRYSSDHPRSSSRRSSPSTRSRSPKRDDYTSEMYSPDTNQSQRSRRKRKSRGPKGFRMDGNFPLGDGEEEDISFGLRSDPLSTNKGKVGKKGRNGLVTAPSFLYTDSVPDKFRSRAAHDRSRLDTDAYSSPRGRSGTRHDPARYGDGPSSSFPSQRMDRRDERLDYRSDHDTRDSRYDDDDDPVTYDARESEYEDDSEYTMSGALQSDRRRDSHPHRIPPKRTSSANFFIEEDDDADAELERPSKRSTSKHVSRKRPPQRNTSPDDFWILEDGDDHNTSTRPAGDAEIDSAYGSDTGSEYEYKVDYPPSSPDTAYSGVTESDTQVTGFAPFRTSSMYHPWEQMGKKYEPTPTRSSVAPHLLGRGILRKPDPTSSTLAPTPLPNWKRPLTVQIHEIPEENYWKTDRLTPEDDNQFAWSPHIISDSVSARMDGFLKHEKVDARIAPGVEKTLDVLYPTVFKASRSGISSLSRGELAQYDSELADIERKGYIRQCDLGRTKYDIISHRGNLAFVEDDKYQKKQIAAAVAEMYLDDKSILFDTEEDRSRYYDSGWKIDQQYEQSLLSIDDPVGDRDYSSGKEEYKPGRNLTFREPDPDTEGKEKKVKRWVPYDLSDTATEERRSAVKKYFGPLVFDKHGGTDLDAGGSTPEAFSSAAEYQMAVWQQSYNKAVSEAQKYKKKGVPMDKINDNFLRTMRKGAKRYNPSHFLSESEFSEKYPLLSTYKSWKDAGTATGRTEDSAPTRTQDLWRRQLAMLQSTGDVPVKVKNPIQLSGDKSEWSSQMKAAFEAKNQADSEMLEHAMKRKAEKEAKKAEEEAKTAGTESTESAG